MPIFGQSLKRIKSSPNSITDDDKWFAENDLSLPIIYKNNPYFQKIATPPYGLAYHYRDTVLEKVIEDTEHFYLVYGKQEYKGKYLIVVSRKNGKYLYGFDLAGYPRSLKLPKNNWGIRVQSVLWAQASGNTLYISHAHPTYASATHGQNAWITAIDMDTLKPVWHSMPLVANAENFVVTDDTIISDTDLPTNQTISIC